MNPTVKNSMLTMMPSNMSQRGGDNMAPSKTKQYGFVRVKNTDGVWTMRYRCPHTQKDVRRKLPVTSDAEAKKYAIEANQYIANQIAIPGMRSQIEEPISLSVDDAIIQSIKTLNALPGVMQDYARNANHFIKWIRKSYPKVVEWGDIKPSMISMWVKSMQEAGLAFDTIRLRLFVIKHASKFWEAEEPTNYRDVARVATIRLERPAKKVIGNLTLELLVKLLNYIKVKQRRLFPMACISACCGLRVYEAAYLRFCDIDFNAKSITIDKTRLHTPKTLSSYRTIPMPDFVVSVVQNYLAESKIVPVLKDTEIFVNKEGNNWTKEGLNSAWTRITKQLRSEGEEFELLKLFTAKDLRATFASLMRETTKDRDMVKRIMGHTSGDVLGDHYEAVSVELMRSVTGNSFVTNLAFVDGGVVLVAKNQASTSKNIETSNL